MQVVHKVGLVESIHPGLGKALRSLEWVVELGYMDAAVASGGEGLVTDMGGMSGRRMQLHLVRGSELTGGAGEGMEAEVWGQLPEEVMWEALRLVPGTKHFQLQLVSRRWREVLTSAHCQCSRVVQPVVACATPASAAHKNSFNIEARLDWLDC